jgi:hypothetical protein
MLITNYIVLSGGSYLFNPFFSIYKNLLLNHQPTIPYRSIYFRLSETKMTVGYNIRSENTQNRRNFKKIQYPGLFYCSPISCHPVKALAHMVAVYIIISYIFIKIIRILPYLRRRTLSLGLIYTKIIKNLLNYLIILYKSDYPHLAPASGAGKRIHFIYLLY